MTILKTSTEASLRFGLALSVYLCPLACCAQVLTTNAEGYVQTVMPPPPPEPSGSSQVVPFTTLPGSHSIQAPPPPESLAPGLLSSLEGINFDEDAANNIGAYHIPPDPHGAAGSNHLVSVVNTSIEWHTKAGVQQRSQRLGRNGTTHVGSFFETLVPTNNLFDPKVIYDQHAGRFLAVALERDDVNVTSRILLAVSDDGDPNGSWYFAAFNGKVNIGGTDTWADYPCIAVDEEAIYIAFSMFPFGFGGYLETRLWIINKTPFYSGGLATFAVYNPYAEAGIPSGGTLQPTHVFGTGGVGGAVGTFLVSAGWVAGPNDFLGVIRVDNPLAAPTFANQFIDLGDIHSGSVPNAPQSGTSELIETVGGRPYHAVWRGNNLYVVNTVNPPSGTDAGQATAHWYRINTASLAALTLADQGNIGGEEIAAGTHTFFPSITVDFRGNVGIGFSASGPIIFPGAYYTGRRPTDAAGTVQPAVALAAGVDFYIRKLGGTRNRWGDYSGTALDPATEMTVWVFNEYTMARGTEFMAFPGEDGRWATRWGSFSFNNLPSAGVDDIIRANTQAVKVARSALLSNDTDVDGDTVTIASVSSTSVNGGTVTVSGNWVFYTPPPGSTDPDSFTYLISDGRGGTQTCTVNVTLPANNAQSENHKISLEGDNIRISFRGIPGRTYRVQFTPSLPATSWTTLASLTADAQGIYEYVDTSGEPSRYYRSVYP